MIGDNKDEKDTRRRLSAENKEGVRDQKQATSESEGLKNIISNELASSVNEKQDVCTRQTPAGLRTDQEAERVSFFWHQHVIKRRLLKWWIVATI
jgi:hypothetical protein